MKKAIACLAAFMTLASLAACSDTAKNDYLLTENNLSAAAQDTVKSETTRNTTNEITGETKVDAVFSETTENVTSDTETAVDTKVLNALNSADYVLNANFSPIYEDVDFLDVQATGSVMSYEELQEYMNAYEDVSFVGYEIISQYTPEEAYAKTGDKIFLHSTTLYQAHIYYDYLNDTPVDMTVDLAKAGMPNQQVENDPPYVIGQKIIAALSGFNSTSCVAIPELVYYIYDIKGVDFAYHVNGENIVVEDATFANLDMDLISNEYSLITTTANNPVRFTQKSSVDDLTQFIKQDWTSRGYKFFDVANFDYNAQPKHNSNEDEMVVE